MKAQKTIHAKIYVDNQSYDYIMENQCFEDLKEYIRLCIPGKPYGYELATSDQTGLRIIFDAEQFRNLCESITYLNILIVDRDINISDLEHHCEMDLQYAEQIQQELKGFIKDLERLETLQINESVLTNKTKNFLIGYTGVGKSTITNICQGFELKCKKHGNSFHMSPVFSEEDQRMNKFAPIGNTHSSCTGFPGVYQCFCNNDLYYDLAGFMDTAGAKQQILNSYTNSLVFQKQSPIRIIIVIQEGQIEGERGNQIKNIMDRLQKLFEDEFLTLSICSVIIVTKCSNLTEQQTYQCLQDIVKPNAPLSQNSRQYLGYIIRQKKIILFPRPSKQGIISLGQYIPQAIKSIDPLPLQKRANISLNPGSRTKMSNLINRLQLQISNHLSILALKFPQGYFCQTKDKHILLTYLQKLGQTLHSFETEYQIYYIYPYSTDRIQFICEKLQLQINIREYIGKMGFLIQSLRSCYKIHSQFKLSQSLFQSFFHILKSKHKLLFQKIQIIEQTEEKAQLQQELRFWQKEQQIRRRFQLEQLKKQLAENDHNLQRQLLQNRRRDQQKLEQMKRQHEQQIQKMKR